MAVVYWIHLLEHTDITSEGYVGVSKTTALKRFAAHKSAAKRGSTYAIYRAIRKYGDKLRLTTLVEGASDYCYELENKLRPALSVGWNAAIGGEIPSTLGKKLSDEHRSAISRGNKGRVVSPETLAKMKSAYKGALARGRFRDWDNGRSNRAVWRAAEALHSIYKTIPECGHRSLARAYGEFTFRQLTAITNKFKSGWIPSEDSDYMTWKATNG